MSAPASPRRALVLGRWNREHREWDLAQPASHPPEVTAPGPYVVELGDPGGTFTVRYAETFDGLLDAYRDLCRKYAEKRPKAFIFANTDRCDIGDNGLTEAERERLEDVVCGVGS